MNTIVANNNNLLLSAYVLEQQAINIFGNNRQKSLAKGAGHPLIVLEIKSGK